MIIRKASPKDLDSVHAIARENSLSHVTQVEEGFLVSEFDQQFYADFLEQKTHFYVCEQDDEILGFLTAYRQDELDMTLMVNRAINSRAQNPYVVIKQICVRKKSTRQGVASRLYHHFMHHINEDIYLAVVLDPYNASSIHFHKRLAFYQDFELVIEDGRPRGIFFWNNPANPPAFDQETLLQQYAVAIDLYKHEDSLNWSKINHLFYITASLLGLAGVSLTLKHPQVTTWILLGASLLGILSAYLFMVTILSGVQYMQTRKEVVLSLEQLLSRQRGVKVVDIQFESHKTLMQKSPSLSAIRKFPRIILCVWLVIFVLALLSATDIITLCSVVP